MLSYIGSLLQKLGQRNDACTPWKTAITVFKQAKDWTDTNQKLRCLLFTDNLRKAYLKM